MAFVCTILVGCHNTSISHWHPYCFLNNFYNMPTISVVLCIIHGISIKSEIDIIFNNKQLLSHAKVKNRDVQDTSFTNTSHLEITICPHRLRRRYPELNRRKCRFQQLGTYQPVTRRCRGLVPILSEQRPIRFEGRAYLLSRLTRENTSPWRQGGAVWTTGSSLRIIKINSVISR